MNKEDVHQYLKDNLYIISDSGSDILTSKFFRDFRIRASNSKDSNSIKSTKSSSSSLTKEDYVKFIDDADVPVFLSNGQGGRFYANRFSKRGFEAFKIASSTTDEKVLLAACKWYYKQNNTSRVMIGTWFAEDIWISCVNDIKKAIENRKIVLSQPEDYSNIIPNIDKEERNSLRL